MVVTVKYLAVVMRADNQGEGGILALVALALRGARRSDDGSGCVDRCSALVGAALFYGDGVITPAISVLGAVEGLQVATPAFEPYVVPITIAILIGAVR